MFNNYADFEVTIQSAVGDSFPIIVQSMFGGDAHGFLRLPKDQPDYQQFIQQLTEFNTNELLLVQLGQILFKTLFQGEIKEAYIRSQGRLTNKQGQRIILNIAASESIIAEMPWEFIQDPDRGPLALLDMPIVRYLPQTASTPIIEARLPLKVLLTGAQIPPTSDIVRELADLQNALAVLEQQQLVEITIESHLTARKLQHLLRQGFHIWHFAGHGGFGFNQDGSAAHLALEDLSGDCHLISAIELSVMLRGSGIQLVVLNACNSAHLTTEPFRSIAPALIRAQIPAVIAMQFSIPAKSARIFAGAFYTAIADGFPIEACLTEGRRAVMYEIGIGRPDWGIPVVYTRARNGFVLTQPASNTSSSEIISQPHITSEIRQAKRKKRIFISYKRHTKLDEPLALHLSNAFVRAGHNVFIDQIMQIGVDWIQEIQQQIENSDYAVFLLSHASVQSEMIAKELEHAYKHYQNTGNAYILPVRIDYNDVLPYQITHFLNQLQYAEWHSPLDNTRLVNQLLDAIDAVRELPILAPVSQSLTKQDPFRDIPRPYADPRFVETLLEPGGGVRLSSPFYIERETDKRLQREIRKIKGTTITISAPRQTGKTSLLIRGLSQAQQQGKKTVAVDMQAVEARMFEGLNTFLRYFATLIFTRLRLDTSLVDKAWQSSLGAPDKTTYLFEDHILQQSTQIVLAIDEADRLLRTNFHDTFFGLLRFWHNNRAMNEQWEQLDLLMVISTEPHLLISDVTQSPFNVGAKIILEDLTLMQVADLNRRYKEPLQRVDESALFALLNGHPYLTNRALYTLVTEEISWKDITSSAIMPKSPFGDHLRRYLWLLRDQPQLTAALRQIITRGRCSDEDSFYRLMQAGLIHGSDSQTCMCRCALYEQYFKDKL